MTNTNEEVEETDADSDSLKPNMAAYLELLNKAVQTYMTDEVELLKIQAQVNIDQVLLYNIAAKLGNSVENIKMANMRRTEAFSLIDGGIKTRKG